MDETTTKFKENPWIEVDLNKHVLKQQKTYGDRLTEKVALMELNEQKWFMLPTKNEKRKK